MLLVRVNRILMKKILIVPTPYTHQTLLMKLVAMMMIMMIVQVSVPAHCTPQIFQIKMKMNIRMHFQTLVPSFPMMKVNNLVTELMKMTMGRRTLLVMMLMEIIGVIVLKRLMMTFPVPVHFSHLISLTKNKSSLVMELSDFIL